MNPQLPPPPIREFFTLPSLILMVILTFLMQVLVIGMNIRHVSKQYKGIWALFFSAFALMLHYGLLSLSMMHIINPATFPLQGIRELFNIIGHALIYLAVCQFVGIRFNRIGFRFVLVGVSSR